MRLYKMVGMMFSTLATLIPVPPALNDFPADPWLLVKDVIIICLACCAVTFAAVVRQRRQVKQMRARTRWEIICKVLQGGHDAN